MAYREQVTVDKSYFDALLRRANVHEVAPIAAPPKSTVTISYEEHESLLQCAREYRTLRETLLQGGVTVDALDTLISGSQGQENRKDSASGLSTDVWTQGASQHSSTNGQSSAPVNVSTPYESLHWRTGKSRAAFGLQTSAPDLQPHLRASSSGYKVSYGPGCADNIFDDDDPFEEGHQSNLDFAPALDQGEQRTLYLTGLPERTTYRDLISVIKGGRLISILLRHGRSATVTLLTGAGEFLAWSKRNDIYLHTKRIEVKWADRQYVLNSHTAKKLNNGATRNLVIRGALERGLTESRIRDDMEHIYNLVIVDITYRAGDAYVSMNSVHHALIAKTCMRSRSSYRSNDIEFFPDECDVPLPASKHNSKPLSPVRASKKPAMTNRFGLLDFGNTDEGSEQDQENRSPPSEHSSEQLPIGFERHLRLA